MKGQIAKKWLGLVAVVLAGWCLAACGQDATATPTVNMAGLVAPNGQITPAKTIAPGTTPTPTDLPASQRINIGAVAPDFTLSTPDDQPVKLSQFRGQPVLINFWATWCPPCRVELPLLVQTYQANKDKLVILGVNMGEDAATVQAKMQQVGIDYPTVLDPHNDVTNLYKVISYPTSLFVDKNGVIQRITVGQLTDDSLKASLSKVLATP